MQMQYMQAWQRLESKDIYLCLVDNSMGFTLITADENAATFTSTEEGRYVMLPSVCGSGRMWQGRPVAGRLVANLPQAGFFEDLRTVDLNDLARLVSKTTGSLTQS